jgi:hypothetical protein
MAARTTPSHPKWFWPATAPGRAALLALAVTAGLLLARVAHVPALNYLVVLLAAAASGAVALLAVLRGERSIAVFGVLIVGALTGTLLLLETVSPPGR